MIAFRARLRRIDPRRLDAVFALAMIIELQLESWLNTAVPASDRPVTAVAALLFAAPIAVRRRAPGLAFLFSLTVAAVQTVLGGALITTLVGDLVVIAVLAYSVGAWLDGRRSGITLGLGLALMIAAGLLPGPDTGPDSLAAVGDSVLLALLTVIPGWLVGRVTRHVTRRAAAFRELAAHAAAERERREFVAVAGERARISSELHDIIAHSVSAMVIQASGARRALRTDPDHARDSILNVEQTGREALADLRRLLGMLRKDDDPRALAPQPGLSQLAALIGSIGNDGLAIELHTEGERVDLTPGVDLVAYRAIEAGLLTAARDDVARAVVTVRYLSRQLELEIRGDGFPSTLEHDLLPVAERVALYDGELRTDAANGEFVVQATLPLAAAVPA